MFGLLKKKLSDTIKNISGKIEDEADMKKESKDKEVKKPVSMKKDKKESKDKADNVEVKENVDVESVCDEVSVSDENVEELGDNKGQNDKGFLSKLTKTFTHVDISAEVLDNLLWDLEVALLENNVAMEVAQKICADVKGELLDESVKRGSIEEVISGAVRKSVREILDQEGSSILDVVSKCKSEGRVAKIVFVGFNGSGKTTNLAKLSKYLTDNGFSSVFAAGDTFRAAAIQQLEEHADNLSVKIVKQDYGADSAAVIFDAVKYAESKNVDVVLADTAGRNHQDSNLLSELEKIVRVIKPDLCILVVESIAGNDVVEQAKMFSKVKLDGFVLSKWDVDNKGGAALTLTYMVRKPIYFLGTGQEYNDFKIFDIDDVVNNII